MDGHESTRRLEAGVLEKRGYQGKLDLPIPESLAQREDAKQRLFTAETPGPGGGNSLMDPDVQKRKN